MAWVQNAFEGVFSDICAADMESIICTQSHMVCTERLPDHRQVVVPHPATCRYSGDGWVSFLMTCTFSKQGVISFSMGLDVAGLHIHVPVGVRRVLDRKASQSSSDIRLCLLERMFCVEQSVYMTEE